MNPTLRIIRYAGTQKRATEVCMSLIEVGCVDVVVPILVEGTKSRLLKVKTSTAGALVEALKLFGPRRVIYLGVIVLCWFA